MAEMSERMQELLMKVAEAAQVYPDDIPDLVRIAARVPRGDTVRRIFIHLERVSSTAGFSDFGRRVCPFYIYFQPALVLLEDGALDAQAVLRVGADLVVAHTFNPEVLVASFDDLRRRGYLSERVVDRIGAVSGSIEPSTFGQASGPLQSLVRAMQEARDMLQDADEVGQSFFWTHSRLIDPMFSARYLKTFFDDPGTLDEVLDRLERKRQELFEE